MSRKSVLPATQLLILLGFITIGLVSCTDSTDSASKTQASKNSNNLTPPRKPATPTANTGIVKSIQNTGGYSYIEVDINGQTFWMASSLSSVKPGEKITWNGHAMMKNFTSKTLNRTFEQIMFVNKVMLASTVAASLHSGTVTETMESAGYSYIQVKEQGKKIWLAAPVTKINVGQKINWSNGAPMRNFVSKSLKRTFEEIFFVSGVQADN